MHSPRGNHFKSPKIGLKIEKGSDNEIFSFVSRTFVIDDFKRFYSNNEVDKSIPYFWEKFDPENYSIWFGEYKYNEELTKVFMSCNLITGNNWIQIQGKLRNKDNST